MLDDRKTEAQQVLDELYSENLVPYKLTAYVAEMIGPATYVIRFHDSRIHCVDFSCRYEHSFKDALRSAVLAEFARINGRVSGPLPGYRGEKFPPKKTP